MYLIAFVGEKLLLRLLAVTAGLLLTVLSYQNCEQPIMQTAQNTEVKGQLSELPLFVEYSQPLSEVEPSRGGTLIHQRTQHIDLRTGEVAIAGSQTPVGCLRDNIAQELSRILIGAEVCDYRAPPEAICAQVLVDPYSVLKYPSGDNIVLGARLSSCGDTTILCGERDEQLRTLLTALATDPVAHIGDCIPGNNP